MLRIVVAVYGVVMLLGAELLMLRGSHWVAIAYLGVNGFIDYRGVIFERSYYQPRLGRGPGHWELTGERFVDPDHEAPRRSAIQSSNWRTKVRRRVSGGAELGVLRLFQEAASNCLVDERASKGLQVARSFGQLGPYACVPGRR